jgi:hypothetical protein
MTRDKDGPEREREDDELEEEQVTDLPDREAMTLIDPMPWTGGVQPPSDITLPPGMPPPGPPSPQ